MTNKLNKKVNFDSISAVYDRLARLVFGKEIINAQRYFLPFIPENAQILIIGGGTGWILTEILALGKPITNITYIDSSEKMIQAAKKKTEEYIISRKAKTFPDIEFITGTENNIPPERKYDVVITYFVLDVFNDKDLGKAMLTIKNATKAHGLWLFSDFTVSNHPVHSKWQLLLIKIMYLFFRWTSNLSNTKLPDFEQHFQNLAYSPAVSASFYLGMIVSRIYRRHFS